MGIRQKLRAYINRRRAIREVSALDDHTTGYVGITRYSIHSAFLSR